MSIDREFVDLRNRAWTTAGARYNAARRLRMRGSLSLATISLISALGVAVPLLLASGSFSEISSDLGLYSSLLSLFILVVAVIEGAAGFDAKADALFRNAESLNAFRMRLNISLSDSSLQTTSCLQEMTNQYEQIKSSCSINHEVVDFNLHKARNPSDYGLPPDAVRVFFGVLFWVLYSSWWLLMIVIAAITGLVIAIM